MLFKIATNQRKKSNDMTLVFGLPLWMKSDTWFDHMRETVFAVDSIDSIVLLDCNHFVT